MNLKTLLPSWTLFLLLGPVQIAMAQPAEDEQVQRLIGEIRGLATEVQQEGAAQRWVVRAMHALAAKYEYPWKIPVVSEDFSDGNFTADPGWEIIKGEFWVDNTLGLRSRSVTESRSPGPDPAPSSSKRRHSDELKNALLGALFKDVRPQRQPSPAKPPAASTERTDIALPVNIPNGFAVKLTLSSHNPPTRSSTLVMSVYQSVRRNWGYALELPSGDRAGLTLRLLRGDRTSVLKTVALPADINDGSSHELSLRRRANGQMELELDGEILASLEDRSFRDPFDGILLSNLGGDFAISGLEILGQRRP